MGTQTVQSWLEEVEAALAEAEHEVVKLRREVEVARKARAAVQAAVR